MYLVRGLDKKEYETEDHQETKVIELDSIEIEFD